MFHHTGYYSLIQYCPDKTKMETSNLGVVLFCPKWNFLDVRLNPSFKRIRRFFRNEPLDTERMRASLYSFKDRIMLAKNDFLNEEDIAQFVDSRANDIILAPPRSIKVENPVDCLNSLFNEIFGTPAAEPPQRQKVIPELDSLFKRPDIQPKIIFNHEVAIPYVNRRFVVPYAFQNGCMNLVTPEILSPNESRAMNRTEKLAIEGDLIQRHVTPDGMRRKIIAVLKLPEEGFDNSAMGRITNFLGEYNIRVLKVCQIGELEQEISALGH